MRTFASRLLTATLLGLLLCAMPMAAQDASQPSASSLPTSSEAAALLHIMSNGLLSHDSRLFLSAFDTAQMPAYESFSGQVRAMFQRTDALRPHLHLLSIEDAGSGTARVQVEAQLELNFADGSVERREETLFLTLAHSAKGWRVVELEPRTLFY